MSIQFYETPMGKTFFQGHVPKLVKALTDIAGSLRKPTTVISPQSGDYDAFLTALYHGNLEPDEEPNNERQTACTQKIIAFQERLRSVLNRDQWLEVEHYRSLLEERHCADREQAFAVGFRCAMTMLAADLSHTDTRQSTHGSEQN